MKMKLKDVKSWLNFEGVIDITHKTHDEIQAIKNKEGYFNEVGYSMGIYGCNGCVLQGHNTLTFYVITARTTALFSI